MTKCINCNSNICPVQECDSYKFSIKNNTKCTICNINICIKCSEMCDECGYKKCFQKNI